MSYYNFFMNTASNQIRFTKNFDISEMLKDLNFIYRGLSEAELLKLALSKVWANEIKKDKNGLTLRQQKDLNEAIVDMKNGEYVGPFEGDSAIKYLDTVSK